MIQQDKNSKILVGLVLAGDVIVLIALYFLLTYLSGIHLKGVPVHHVILISLSYLVSASFFGGVVLHRRRARPDQVVRTVFQNVLGFFAIWIVVLFFSELKEHTWLFYTLFFISSLFLIALFRLFTQFFIRHLRRNSTNNCRVIFVGSSRNLHELYEEMSDDSSPGYSVVGYFDECENESFTPAYLGGCDKVVSFLERGSIDRVYCALPSAKRDDILPIIHYCENNMVRFYSVPNFRNYLQRRVTLEMFSNTPTLCIHPEPLSQIDNRIVKRLFDILFSLLVLIILVPTLFLIFACLIKISSPGPVFFRQKRNGLDGKEFWCYKFRSMRVNAHSDTVQATENDPRKTKVGDFMRRSNIDELPQFINVLLGDMSVVGPRPHMVKHTQEYSALIQSYMVRHLVKPGITGWAQVIGLRGETKQLSDMQARVRADIWYMEHWTFVLDLYIIFKTVYNMVVRKNNTKAF